MRKLVIEPKGESYDIKIHGNLLKNTLLESQQASISQNKNKGSKKSRTE